MRMLVLGAGDAFATRDYNSAALIEGPAGFLLLDCPAPIHRVLHEATTRSGWDCTLAAIDDIVLTHLHGDHCSGLEMAGFDGLVQRMLGHRRRPPRLHTHPLAAERVWERLAPSMETDIAGARCIPGALPDVDLSLEDYFELHVLPIERPVRIAGLEIVCRYTRHTIPTIALKISDGRRTLGWSGDTIFDPALVDWLAPADLIVHEAGEAPIHTAVERLAELPAEIRGKMRINHLRDDYDRSRSTLEPLRFAEVIEI